MKTRPIGTLALLSAVAVFLAGLVGPAASALPRAQVPAPADAQPAAPNPAPLNPFLARSEYPVPHGNAAQQDSTAVAGPTGPTRPLFGPERKLQVVGPGHFGMYVSGPYEDGRRVIWSNGISKLVKLDYDTFEILAEYPLAGGSLTDLSGVYALLDVDGNFYVGGRDGITVYTDATPGDPGSGIAKGETYALPDEVTGALIGINMTFDGRLVLATEHGWVVAVTRDFADADVVRMLESENAEEYTRRRTLGKGWVRNGYAIDEAGGIYLVSADHMHKIVWTGERLSTDETDGAWVEPYSNDTTAGSGATPSLMGFGDEDELVVITDGDRRMNLVLYWRDEIPADWEQLPGASSRRVAGVLPTTMGSGKIQSEQSVVVAGYGAAVVNNEPRVPEWLPAQWGMILGVVLGIEQFKPIGMQKYEWDPEFRELKDAWVNNRVSSPNAVPFVSLGSDLVYTVGVRSGNWTLEGIDWWSGESEFHYVVGNFLYNSLFAGVILDDRGRILYGTILGMVRLEPRPG